MLDEIANALVTQNKCAFQNALSGWKHAVKYDRKYIGRFQELKESLGYAKDNQLQHIISCDHKIFSELLSKNASTSRHINSGVVSDVAVIGCGPVGMAFAIHLKIKQPNISVAIYEKRIKDCQILPFNRAWLTDINRKLITKLLLDDDLRFIDEIGKNNRIGVSLCDLEFMLLRSLRSHEIPICQFRSLDSINASYLVDASGNGLPLNERKGVKPLKVRVPLPDTWDEDYAWGQIYDKRDPVKEFFINDVGCLLEPRYGSSPLEVGYLKIHNVSCDIHDTICKFLNSRGEYGLYVWPGEMRIDYNRSVMLLAITPAEYRSISLITRIGMSLNDFIHVLGSHEEVLNRIRFILNAVLVFHSNSNLTPLVDPPFIWAPRFRPRSELSINNIPRLVIGDSYFIGNPKCNNGLSYHLSELDSVFS